MTKQYGIVLCGIAFFIFSSLNLSAQISLGIKAGGNLYDNYQTGNKYFTSQPNIGFHAGAFGDYPFSEKISARIEALFSTRGLYASEVYQNGRINFERQTSYIDFPLSANYKLFPSVTLHAGVVPSLFVEEYRAISTNEADLKVDQGDQFRSYERWQFGAFAGAAYSINLFDKDFEIGARYSMGLSRTYELIREVRASRDPKYMMLQLYIACPLYTF